MSAQINPVIRLLTCGMVLSSFSVAHLIPQHGVFGRQAASNVTTTTIPSTITPSATLPTPTAPTTTTFGNGTCLSFYPADYPQEWQVWSTPCEEASSANQYYYPNYADECLRSYCDWQWESTMQSYLDANITETTTSTRTYFSGIFGTGSLSTVVTQQTFWTSTLTYVLDGPKAVSPVAPCCDQCRISAKTVELFYWPVPTATPNATALPTDVPITEVSYVDDAGFTFISPSIYIAFTSLGAHDRCGVVGTEIYNMTMGFDPDEISSILTFTTTATCTITNKKGAVFTQAELSTPAPQPLTMSDVAQNCSTIEGYYYFSGNPFYTHAGDPCHPVIALPTRVRDLQAAWADCMADYNGGFYDPPKTLNQGTMLVPTTASPGPSNPTVVPPTSTSVPALPEETPDPEPSSTLVESKPPVSTPEQPEVPASTLPETSNPPALTPSERPNPPVSTPSNPLNIPASTPSEQPNLPVSTPSDPPKPPSSTPSEQPNPPASTSSERPNLQESPSQEQSNPSATSALEDEPSTPASTLNSQSDSPESSNNPQAPAPGSSSTIITTPPKSDQISPSQNNNNSPAGPSSSNPSQTTIEAPLVITLGGTTLTANSATQFVLDSSTLSIGGAPITVSGTTYVLTTNEQGSTQLVVGTAGDSSIATAHATATSKTGNAAPENSVAVAAQLKKVVNVTFTVVIVAVLLG